MGLNLSWGLAYRVDQCFATESVLKQCHTGQAADHQRDHHDAHHGCARAGQIFIILGSAAVAAKPAEGPFDLPPLRQELAFQEQW
jgi:hypothetical protein